MARIRLTYTPKGGVGKSSITVNLAACAAASGKRTLVVDLDAQANTTHYLLGDAASGDGPSIYKFFEQQANYGLRNHQPGDFMRETPFPSLWIMAAHPELNFLQAKLEARAKTGKLRDMLSQLRSEFDEIYIDTGPAYNFYSISGLVAADTCLIPFDCDSFSLDAMRSLMLNIGEIAEDHNPALKVEGIVINQWQPRAKLPQRMVDALKADGLPVLEAKLSSSIAMRESHSRHMPLIHMDRSHKLSQEFLALYQEITPV
ncbi:chromosome partitioning protein [Noviherbaspirillum humi]|uniref:Chromosome partitioning protein n=1 Tax=Noviherbaspirillum humi TaxID=1688639 RepID=A0A239LS12_9BURK|nr:ParA family protein [Noviherbaspirillum humi]SNT32489.1 chromosome partitioning protein [Noviherbaspirillum humi]